MGTINTIPARCKDCFKCLRSCPVKAIRFNSAEGTTDLRAQVVEEKCILDGACVIACPQQAKKVRSDLDKVRTMLARSKPVVLILAPSFAAAFPGCSPLQVVEACRRLGFGPVHETAWAAEAVGRAHVRELAGRTPEDLPLLTSSCPVVVNLIEKHYPGVLPFLAPIPSPMVLHARYLREKNPAARVVFAGPCLGKKEEGEAEGILDAVLTFEELREWFGMTYIDPVRLPESTPDGPYPDKARLFPLEGGLLRTAALSSDVLAEDVSVITGIDNCMETLQKLSSGDRPPVLKLIEIMACSGGCINGPGMPAGLPNIYTRKHQVINYFNKMADKTGTDSASITPALLDSAYCNKQKEDQVPDEATMRAILAEVGKTSLMDELNCGACGYPSCRDKAVAVYNGYAELEMCIPYMRERAESLFNLALEAAPQGAVVVGEDMIIRQINPAALAMFGCQERKLEGKRLDDLIDPSYFAQVIRDKNMIKTSVHYPQYHLYTEQIIFYVFKQRVAIGFFSDVSTDQRLKHEMGKIREDTVAKAQEVITKQMQVAQEIAGLLGETTAETKVLLTKLIELMRKS